MVFALSRNFLILVTFLVVVAVVWQWQFAQSVTLDNFKQSADYFYEWTQNNYVSAFLYYCVLFIVATACMIPITIILTIAGGFLFGPLIGGAYAVFCATMGSAIIFLVVRYLLGNIIQMKYKNRLQSFNMEIARQGKWYILLAQIFPFTPMPLLNVGAGLTKMSVWTFAWATAIGLIPGTLIYTFAGQYIHQVQSIDDIVSWKFLLLMTLGAIMLLLPIVWNFLNRKKLYNFK